MLVVLVVGVVAIMAGRCIRQLRSKNTAAVEAEASPEIKAKSQPALAQRFQSWGTQAFAADPNLVHWLNYG